MFQTSPFDVFPCVLSNTQPHLVHTIINLLYLFVSINLHSAMKCFFFLQVLLFLFSLSFLFRFLSLLRQFLSFMFGVRISTPDVFILLLYFFFLSLYVRTCVCAKVCVCMDVDVCSHVHTLKFVTLCDTEVITHTNCRNHLPFRILSILGHH